MQRDREVKSAMIVIDMVKARNLLAPFCCVFRKDTLRPFSMLTSLGKLNFSHIFIKKQKAKIKSFNRTAISRQLQKQVRLIACSLCTPSVAFLRVRRINIEIKKTYSTCVPQKVLKTLVHCSVTFFLVDTTFSRISETLLFQELKSRIPRQIRSEDLFCKEYYFLGTKIKMFALLQVYRNF